MNKPELIELFTDCNERSPIFTPAQAAKRRLEDSDTYRIVMGGSQSCADLLRIYMGRQERMKDSGVTILGLEETTRMFAGCNLSLKGGYAETQFGLIYFWIDDGGNLVGCILEQKSTS